MNDLIKFDFQGNQVRTIMRDNEPWWVAKDVCKILGYKDPTTAIRSHCRGVPKLHPLDTAGGTQNLRIINEPDLYRLIIGSNLPEAEQFENWIFEEVVPQIRKTGGYSLNMPKTLPEALRAYATEIEKREQVEQQLKIVAPKAEFYDQVAGSADAIEMREVAAVLNRNGWGRNKVFSFLRQTKILDENNLPYRHYQDEGYFRVVEQKYTDATGETRISLKTLVYQKGIEWIRRLLKRYENTLPFEDKN